MMQLFGASNAFMEDILAIYNNGFLSIIVVQLRIADAYVILIELGDMFIFYKGIILLKIIFLYFFNDSQFNFLKCIIIVQITY